MKKALSLLLALLMCLSLCACGGGTVDTPTTAPTTAPTTVPTEPPLLIDAALSATGGFKIINYSRFGECIKEVVELSTDNWHEYIDSISYTEEVIVRDAFDEIIEVKSLDRKAFGVADGNYYYHYEDVVIELQHKDSGEKTVFEIRDGEGYFNIENYICTRIKGRIYIVDIPAEAILEPVPDWGYKCGFVIGDAGFESPYEINPYTKVIYHNGAENWEEKYMR